MLRFVSRNILTGSISILPVALTLYLLYWAVVSVESWLGGLMQWLLPKGLYLPGMGFIAGLAVLFVVGLLTHAYVVQSLFARGEQLLYHVPVIKSVYRAIHDFFDYFSPKSKRDFEQVVVVTIGNTGMRVMGFVTQALPDHLPRGFAEDDSVLVYLPMSYMIGGYAVLMPRAMVRPLDINMEEAMRFTLTAGVAGHHE